MMQAIETRYIGATDYSKAKVEAMAEAGSMTIDWDSEKSMLENYIAAAKALAEKLEWFGQWCGGVLRYGYAFIQITDNCSFEVVREIIQTDN
jgi:hypothetical protein